MPEDEAMPVDLTNAEIKIILAQLESAMWEEEKSYQEELDLYKKLKDILFLRTLFV